MSLTHHIFPSSSSSSPSCTLLPNSYSSKPHLLFAIACSKPLKSLSLLATSNSNNNNTTPPVSLSTSPDIFLPFLNQEDDDPEPESQEQAKDEAEEVSKDPILRFFKSRTSTQDPERESRMTLQKNRRSSWRLAPNAAVEDDNSVSEGEFDGGIEPETKIEEVGSGSGSAVSDSSTTVVGEIVGIARDLPENLTLGEVLGSYTGRVGERECVEVLEMMGQEGLVVGCLYFFEWMGLQEPSLVTPRACSVLFPVLGKAGMGDKLMILFGNLPKRRRFMDVHVYNAAMSGLLCSRR